MKRKAPSITMCMILIFAIFISVDMSFEVIIETKGNVIYVNETGTNGALPSIQMAIDVAFEGDTIFVYNGTYFEWVFVDKLVNLVGEHRNGTLIYAPFGGDDVVRIEADWVNITGFTVDNGGSDPDAGIKLNNVNNCSVIDNNAYMNSNHGISLISSTNNNISENRVIGNGGNGIFLDQSSNNTITHNYGFINDNGIYLESSHDNDIIENYLSTNNRAGIRLDNSNYNNITGNGLPENWYGVYLDYSIGATIINNTMVEDGIFIRGDMLEQWNTQNISTSNTVNGRPVYYWKNQTSGEIPLDAGEVILANCTNIKIENLNLTNGSIGIEAGFCSDIEINNNSVSGNLRGIELYYSNSSSISNNTVIDNGIEIRFSENIVICNNTSIKGGIGVYESSGLNTIRDNWVASSPLGKGIHIDRSDNSTVINNTVLDNRWGIDISFCNGVSVLHNNITNNEYRGLIISYANGCFISENIIINNSYGINIVGSKYLDITNNTMTKNGIFIEGSVIEQWNTHAIDTSNTVNEKPMIYWKNQTGGIIPPGAGEVILANCSDITVKGQELTYCTVGIEIGFSSNIDVQYNNASSSIYGIRLYKSDNVTITNNNVFFNRYRGIELGFSIDNQIYHNNIIKNYEQAYDSTHDSNQWDNGYPSGGNYWSDYTGTDGNGDGIGDTPYDVDWDTKDYYPLMGPLGNFTFLYEGWNLISTPFIQSDTDLTSVLSSIDGSYDAVQWYNSSFTSKSWKHHRPGKPYGNDLNTITHEMGFWIHITEHGGVLFQYLGTPPLVNQTIPIYPGWNLIGYPSLTRYNRTDGLNNLTFGADVDAIWSYNAATRRWNEMNGSDYFEAGRGYWVHANKEVTWVVPV